MTSGDWPWYIDGPPDPAPVWPATNVVRTPAELHAAAALTRGLRDDDADQLAAGQGWLG